MVCIPCMLERPLPECTCFCSIYEAQLQFSMLLEGLISLDQLKPQRLRLYSQFIEAAASAAAAAASASAEAVEVAATAVAVEVAASAMAAGLAAAAAVASK